MDSEICLIERRIFSGESELVPQLVRLYQKIGELEKAIDLYQKAGDLERAWELALNVRDPIKTPKIDDIVVRAYPSGRPWYRRVKIIETQRIWYYCGYMVEELNHKETHNTAYWPYSYEGEDKYRNICISVYYHADFPNLKPRAK